MQPFAWIGVPLGSNEIFKRRWTAKRSFTLSSRRPSVDFAAGHGELSWPFDVYDMRRWAMNKSISTPALPSHGDSPADDKELRLRQCTGVGRMSFTDSKEARHSCFGTVTEMGSSVGSTLGSTGDETAHLVCFGRLIYDESGSVYRCNGFGLEITFDQEMSETQSTGHSQTAPTSESQTGGRNVQTRKTEEDKPGASADSQARREQLAEIKTALLKTVEQFKAEHDSKGTAEFLWDFSKKVGERLLFIVTIPRDTILEFDTWKNFCDLSYARVEKIVGKIKEIGWRMKVIMSKSAELVEREVSHLAGFGDGGALRPGGDADEDDDDGEDDDDDFE
eukprot:GDKH01015776.1.p1 GENE.GDKH01015776.1~~GDKH01015776.1.p1  ORF type:complete len:335 (-),score=24.25 GDKH01015776.1:147-1151(-)